MWYLVHLAAAAAALLSRTFDAEQWQLCLIAGLVAAAIVVGIWVAAEVAAGTWAVGAV